jgi:hypothetical protein
MLMSWLTRTSKTRQKPQRLALEWLEAREVPALNIIFDYSFDTAGFFSDPGRRAILQQAANDIAGHIDTSLAPIAPGGGNYWNATFFNPADGQQASVSNLYVPADTIVVYAGGRAFSGAEAGVGGNGGYGGGGSSDWLSTLQTRGASGYSLWGGSIAFDLNRDWFFGSTTSGMGSTQIDFYSVASHELGHVLGLGTARQWFNQVSGGYFDGPNAESLYGGPVPTSENGSHWADGLSVGGVRGAMDPVLQLGARDGFSPLDYAALQDIGWAVNATPATPLPTNPTPSGDGTSGGGSVIGAVALTGARDGSAQGFNLSADGTLTAAGSRFQPFPGFAGVIRSVVADFNGDGVADAAFGTGPGTAARVRVIDGATGKDLVGVTAVLDGFAGGVYLAAGDVDRDGKAELAVSADAGGSTRIQLLDVSGGKPSLIDDFFAFGDPAFRGGSRVAMGDVNRDGAADLVVGAGVGGGPRIAVYDGNALAAGKVVSLVPDFFALDPSLRSGVFVTAGDFDGDGYADVAYSTGDTGGPRVEVIGGAVLTANPGKDAYTLPAMANFFALDPADRSGLRIAAHDLDGDGKAEMIVASGSKTNAEVRVLSLADMQNGSGPQTKVQNPLGDPATIDGPYIG